MAAYLRWMGSALLFHYQISVINLVLGTQEAILSVQAPVKYVVAGRTLSLDCEVNSTTLSAGRVSWKHEGKWLHNLTRRLGTKVQLIIARITPQQHGIYHCSVFNVSKKSQDEDIPHDANATVLVGGPISKPKCVSNRKVPPKTLLMWNILENKQSDLEFTYNVFYCYNPSSKRNKFCRRPPFGYNMSRHCSDLAINSNVSSRVVNCNVTSIFKMVFPSMYDFTQEVSPGVSIFFVVNIGNIQSDRYSPPSLCRPLESVKCTKPENIRVMNKKRKTLSLVWDAPKDMGDLQKFLHYLILIAEDGDDKNQTTDFVSQDFHTVENLHYDFISLHSYTLHHIYIACSTSPQYGDSTRGEYIGPFSLRTLEEEPSDHPKITENLTSTVLRGEYRNVTFTWTLPNKETWNGIITHFVLHYWTINSSVSAKSHDASQVQIFSNVSNTTGTLTNLRLSKTYAVTVQMCTRVGCGPTSQPIYIPEETATDTTPSLRKERQVNVLLIVGVAVGLVLCIVCAFISVYLWRRKQRKRKAKGKMKPLSEVIGDVSPPPLYEDPNETNGSGIYDKAFAPLLTDKPEYVPIRSSQTEPLKRKRSEHDADDDKNCTEV